MTDHRRAAANVLVEGDLHRAEVHARLAEVEALDRLAVVIATRPVPYHPGRARS